MKITYDPKASASYIYFTKIGVGGVDRTVSYYELFVELDGNDQIVCLKLVASEDCQFQNRLKYLVQHPEVEYRESDGRISIMFPTGASVEQTISWDCNIDLDRDGQIVGLEILFAPPDYEPDDGIERLSAENRLDHIAKYLVPFDDDY